MLHKIEIKDFVNAAGTKQDIRFSYQVFGLPLGQAPIVLVNHSLTGNSEITGIKGWWNDLVGDARLIDTTRFTVLAFNMPGNGYDGEAANLLHNYKEFTLGDIARIYLKALEQLQIKQIFAGIGGSIGGALLWELASLKPNLFEHVIPVATNYKATQWLKALCKIQGQILENSAQPLQDARMHAMTFYRTPQSLEAKFNGSLVKTGLNRSVEGWLEYHGKELEQRFQLASYKLMNHLLTTSDISNGTGNHLEAAAAIKGAIHIVTVNSDLFYLPQENWDTYVNLALIKKNSSIHEIKSIHGHDAFLIEHQQLAGFLDPIFNNKLQDEKNKHNTLWSR